MLKRLHWTSRVCIGTPAKLENIQFHGEIQLADFDQLCFINNLCGFFLFVCFRK